MNFTSYTICLPCQFPDNVFIHKRRQEKGEIQVHSCHRDLTAPNLETVNVFGIAAIPTQLVVIAFLKVPFFCKSTCPRHGFAGPEALVPFHLLLGSTSWYLPAPAHASDRHVTDMISFMSRQSRVMSAVCLSYGSVIYIRTFTEILSGL